MTRRVFVTGGGGFVGRRLLPALRMAGLEVVAIDRSGGIRTAAPAGVTVIAGDLLDPATYRAALRDCDVALHLAAATGAASAEEHLRVNARGTELLIDECRQAGVTKFLYVSSIAATFADVRGYYYAQAKIRAEQLVRDSGLRWLMLRPTMILGPGAPILRSLEKLAGLPVAVMPGNGRARVQPIHVDDVVSCLREAIARDRFDNEVIDLGGPDDLSFEDLLRRIRASRVGSTGPLVRVPLPVFQWPLRFAEAIGLGRLLPITAGQLTSFRFDGVGRPNWLVEAVGVRRGLDEMLRSDAAPTPAAPEPPVAVEAADILDAECHVLTRHLVGTGPSDYVRATYRNAHAALPSLSPRGPFEKFLVSFARRGAWFARMADAHAALFARASCLRRKMVILLAILETCHPSFETIDAPVGGSPVGAVVRLTVTAGAAMLALLTGSIVLFPARLVLAIRPGGAK